MGGPKSFFVTDPTSASPTIFGTTLRLDMLLPKKYTKVRTLVNNLLSINFKNDRNVYTLYRDSKIVTLETENCGTKSHIYHYKVTATSSM